MSNRQWPGGRALVVRKRRGLALVVAAAALVATAVSASPASGAYAWRYSVESNPHYNAVCYNTSQTCYMYPTGWVRTGEALYRNWNEMTWNLPPYTVGRVIYTDGAGNWTDSNYAGGDASTNTVRLGPSGSARKAVCNVKDGSTNTVWCTTTYP
ncbi:MAG: hypothetical protein M3321_01740 [Actinomycetota bacterium]|nr:hypothetical protein [Actinomycetota bacterium]